MRAPDRQALTLALLEARAGDPPDHQGRERRRTPKVRPVGETAVPPTRNAKGTSAQLARDPPRLDPTVASV